MRRWVSFHGISLNVEPELSHFDGIVPCGVSDHGVTSLVDLGLPLTMPEVDSVLRAEFERDLRADRRPEPLRPSVVHLLDQSRPSSAWNESEAGNDMIRTLIRGRLRGVLSACTTTDQRIAGAAAGAGAGAIVARADRRGRRRRDRRVAAPSVAR